jgi:hypothetical protein
MTTFKPKSSDDYRQNHGVPGVVYILENPGLKAGYLKIGSSRHSGAARAEAMNKDANTGTPGLFRCIFECGTQDCGWAEERVHDIFHEKRRGKFGENKRGKWGQEFFEVDFAEAKKTIAQVCRSIDNAAKKSKNIQISDSVPTTIAAKLSQPAYDDSIVTSNQDNHFLLESQTTNKTSNSGVFGKLLTLPVNFIAALFYLGISFVVSIFAFFLPVALLFGIVLSVIFMITNYFVGESSPPPDPKPAQVTPHSVETSTPIKNVFQWYPDTQPITTDMDAEALGDTKNEVDGVKLIHIAAEEGSAYMQYKLGIMYTEGQGVPHDVVEGVKWLRMAANQGSINAQYKLGIMFTDGQGVQQEIVEGVKWLRMAADQGSINAQYKLGVMHTESRNSLLPDVGKTVGEADNSVTKVRRAEVTREQAERDRLKKLDGDECKISAECAGVLICAKVNPSLMQCMSSDAALKLLSDTPIQNVWGRE